jgi:hypothetical protein
MRINSIEQLKIHKLSIVIILLSTKMEYPIEIMHEDGTLDSGL